MAAYSYQIAGLSKVWVKPFDSAITSSNDLIYFLIQPSKKIISIIKIVTGSNQNGCFCEI